MAENEKETPFVVRDHRRFGKDGEPREEVPPGAAATAADALREGPKGPSPEEDPAAGPAPRALDFTTFVFSLGSSALIHLGDQPNPETGALSVNLPLAKETIDVVAMLQEKTKGNLTPEEARFLSALLYDLRLRFVEASRKHG